MGRSEFLGWDEPVLTVAARRLAEDHAVSPGLSLQHITVALPGQRAGRALLAALMKEAEKRETILVPPDIVTPGRIPELFYRSEVPVLTDLEAEFHWVVTLEGNRETVSGLFAPSASASTLGAGAGSWGFSQWYGVSKTLNSLRSELGALGAGIIETVDKLLDGYVATGERWEALREIMSTFEENLETKGVADIHLARMRALEGGLDSSERTLLLIGTLDLPPVAKRFIEESGVPFEAWVHAPTEYADGFDQFGSVAKDYWANKKIAIDDERIHLAQSFSGQAAITLEVCIP